MNRKIPPFKYVASLLFANKKLAMGLILAAIASGLSNVLATVYIGNGIDTMLGKGQINWAGLKQVLLILGLLYLTAVLSGWLVAHLSNKIGYTIVRDLRQQAFEKLNRLPLSYFDRTPHGDIVSRFTNDLDNVSDTLALSLVSLFTGAITVISVFIFMIQISLPMTVVIVAVTALNFLAAWVIAHLSQNTFQKQQQIVGSLSGYISEMVGELKTVKYFGYEEASIQGFKEINDNLNVTGVKAQFTAAIMNPTSRVLEHISTALVAIVGAFGMIATGGTIGAISQMVMFSGQFAKPFNEVSGIMANLQTAMASLERVRSLLAEKEEEPDNDNAIELVNPQGKVEFVQVDFSYTSNPLIQNLNIKAEPGNLIAIVGPTGAGKTTIVNLLMRFYELDRGKILVDDHDITTYTKSSLRRAFGMVLQDTWLFHGTIRDNIAYGTPNVTQEEIEHASKEAHAHSFIMKMPEGYDTIIDEDGGNLSQGQKQLLTIARVMLTNPAILILDEATSSIDSLTEVRVQKAFLSLMKGRTSFVIAHRLSTITQADSILVLDKGTVVETGNHQQLLAKKGFYYKLYQSQFE